MNIVKTVNRGDAMQVVWANSVANAINNSVFTNEGSKQRIKHTYRPFQPIALWYKEGDGWYLKIQEGYYYDDNKLSITVGTAGGDAALETYPEILVAGSKAFPKNLVFNYYEKHLGWQSPSEIGNLTILEIVYSTEEGNDGFTIKQHIDEHIDLRRYPPFSELICNDGFGNLKVGLTDGVLIERIPCSEASDALKNWVPFGLRDAGARVYHDITPTETLACLVHVDEAGFIASPDTGTEAVELVIEPNNTPSTHFKPDVAGVDGAKGVYHYKMVKDGHTRVAARDNLNHWHDVPWLDNFVNPAPPNQARPIIEYDPDEAKYIFRLLARRDGSQLQVGETPNTMQVGGNQKAGSFTVSTTGYGGGSSASIHWDDGLVTDNGNRGITIAIPEPGDAIGTLKYKVGNETTTNDLISWDAGLVQETADLVIPIPAVVEGEGIDVSFADNVYTVSTDGANLNLSILYASFDADGHKVPEYAEIESVLYFRNGLFVGTTDPEDSPTNLIEKSVSLARDVT